MGQIFLHKIQNLQISPSSNYLKSRVLARVVLADLRVICRPDTSVFDSIFGCVCLSCPAASKCLCYRIQMTSPLPASSFARSPCPLCVVTWLPFLREVSDRVDAMNFWECELLSNYACQVLANLCLRLSTCCVLSARSVPNQSLDMRASFKRVPL